jgi:hypothetical protein
MSCNDIISVTSCCEKKNSNKNHEKKFFFVFTPLLLQKEFLKSTFVRPSPSGVLGLFSESV